MSRMFVVSLTLLALLDLVAPPDAFAQAAAPQPKFIITGLIDNVGTWTQNISTFDYNAGAGAPVRKDIGVQDIAISAARVRFNF